MCYLRVSDRILHIAFILLQNCSFADSSLCAQRSSKSPSCVTVYLTLTNFTGKLYVIRYFPAILLRGWKALTDKTNRCRHRYLQPPTLPKSYSLRFLKLKFNRLSQCFQSKNTSIPLSPRYFTIFKLLDVEVTLLRPGPFTWTQS